MSNSKNRSWLERVGAEDVIQLGCVAVYRVEKSAIGSRAHKIAGLNNGCGKIRRKPGRIDRGVKKGSGMQGGHIANRRTEGVKYDHIHTRAMGTIHLGTGGRRPHGNI